MTRPPADPPAAIGRGPYLRSVLAALWPEPGQISRHVYTAPARPAGATEFLVLPSEGHATLLIPRSPRRVAAAALRNYKASGRRQEQLRFHALSLAVRLGAAEILPDRVMIRAAAPGPAADIIGYLREALGCELMVSLHIGPARANRKPVLQVLTPQGQIIGFVKVGMDKLTCELVAAEATALAVLDRARLAQLETPRLLHHGQWRRHEVLVQQAFPAGRTPTTSAIRTAMAELAGVHGLRRQAAADSPYWAQLVARLRAIGPHQLGGPLLAAMDLLEPVARETSLAFGAWHGDWTPWNMTMSPAGRARVWDWERFCSGVPVGYDAIHYQLLGGIIRSGAEPQHAAETMIADAPGLIGALGISLAADAARLAAMLYLVEIATRYLHDGQAESGNRLGQIDTWLTPVLTRHARLLAGTGDRAPPQSAS